MSKKLGLLGPIVVAVGVAIAGVAVWYMVHAKPHAGDEIDSFDLGDGRTLVVRAESGGDRSFVELRAGDDVKWQALVPHYAGAKGRPAIAWGSNVVSVRVERDGRAEVFALALEDSAKVGGYQLAPEHGKITPESTGPITLTDHVRTYEIVGGSGWHQLVGVDLRTGHGLWKVELGPEPIRAGGVEGAVVWLDQGTKRRKFKVFTGLERYDLETDK